MKTAGERIDDMITISLNNIKGLKQICCTDNYARNILLKNNEKNDIGTKFENQNYMDNALKHIASMDTLILRATIVNKYGNIYCTDTSIPEEYVKTIRNMTKEWMLFEGKEDEYYYGGLQGDNANILTFLYPLHTYGNTPIALLAVDINYKTFQSILENAFYENSGECFILTGEQELFHIGEGVQMSSRGYAILLNTYTRSKFEMGSFSNVAYNMSVEDKVLDYVIWMGNDYKALLKSYINQTGKIPMIPKWALGLWMSKCSYQTQDEIYEVVKISKERDIKIDVIHIDGWQKEGDAGAWVWDYERFPNPEEMIYKLKKEGIHLCLWIFPYIDENSKYFKEAEEKGFLVKNTKGVTSRFYSTATSTSKVGCFDFTNPHFIEWYKPKVRSVVSMGIGAVKTDFSEAVPEDAVYFDGSTGIQGHNKLTFLYAKTIYDIMAEVKIPLGELPMLWGRSGYAGSHTIPAAWAGDSSTHLNNHACILRGGLSASMSGIPFWGFDMGGFYNTDHEGYECVPTDEEYIRSCQFGFFNSLSRCHGKTPREPWNFGEKAEKIFKKFNDIRHLLLPYLYSTTYKTHLSDIPVIRPVVMEYPEDRSARNVELEYFLGDSLLVVPVFDQEDEIDVYLPNGQWIDLFTHERIKGGRWVKRKIELDKIPVFIRQNKMIPMLTKIPENIEEKYENLDVILFCEDEIRDTYIDDGNVQNLKAKIEEGTLFINTDMDASYFTVYAEKCLDNAVVNGQNWEIKKEKEGYYKIALEK